tara:strand:- start:1668 stop:1784 length:117 start_codon:yes stop_codon:yes gene_type:complete
MSNAANFTIYRRNEIRIRLAMLVGTVLGFAMSIGYVFA